MQLIIRADATLQTGTGHVMRCAAVAEAWHRQGGKSRFLTRCTYPDLLARIESTGTSLERIESARYDGDLFPRSQDTTNTVVLLDGYQFDEELQKCVRASGHKLAVVDDLAHLSSYSADVIINQNIGAEHCPYLRDAETKMLLGPRYAMLRAEFKPNSQPKRQVPAIARSVLVTMGGSDPDNFTLTVLQVLKEIQDLQTTVVVGAANPHVTTLRVEAARDPRLRLVVNASNMATLMAEADLAITAAGSTCWEFAFIGTPMVAVPLAENQHVVARGLSAAGIAHVPGGPGQRASAAEIREAVRHLRMAPDCRSMMAQRGQELVDARGAERVASVLRLTAGKG